MTGANSNVGAALVRHLCAERNTFVVATTRETKQPGRWGSRFRGVHLGGVDLTRASDVRRLVRTVSESTRGPFHVINGAGYFPGYHAISRTTLEMARRVLESNVLAVFSTAAALAPVMARRGGGHFIAFSSHALRSAYPLMGVFLSAKAAVESLIRSIANEYSEHGVVATALALATVDSSQERQLIPRGDYRAWIKPAKLAQLIRHIIDAPSPMMNGNTLQLFNHSPTYFGMSFFDRIGVAASGLPRRSGPPVARDGSSRRNRG